jgi:predicted Zn-dependent protease
MARVRKVLVAIGVVAAVAGGWFAWRAVETQAVVVRSLPRPPDVRSRPPELQSRLARADTRARGYLHPASALVELSRLYHANGFFAEANACYAGLRRVQPDNAHWPHLEASILAGSGELEEARPLFRKAVALAPGYLPARLRLADTLLKANQAAEAAKIYEEVFARQPDEPYALLGLARGAVAGGDWEKAREYTRRSAAAHPDFGDGLIFGATVAEHFGDLAGAAALRARASSLESIAIPDPWLDGVIDDCYDAYRLSVAAAVALAQGNTNSAERWLLRAIDFSAKPAAYHRQLGNLYVRLKNDGAARQHFQDATRLEPTDSDAWAFLVNLLNSTGDRAAAYRAVATGLASCPDSRALHYAYGHMLTEDGRFPQAMAELRAAKRLQPNEANAYVDLALIHFQLGQVDSGVGEMRDALKVQPDHPLALTLLARRAIDLGDESGAAALFRRIRQQILIDRGDVEALAQAYRQQFKRSPP